MNWHASGRPVFVDETVEDVEVTEDEVEEARQNYLQMDATNRAYVDALRRRFPDGDDIDDGRTFN